MSTANNTNGSSGGAASPREDIGDDVMSEVAKNLGQSIPKTDAPAEKKPKAAAPAAGEGEVQETEEEKTARLANETPEEKTAREEKEAADAAAAAAAETEEEKTARLANETPEEKAAREKTEADEAAAAEAERAKDPARADKDAAAKELEAALKDADPDVRKAAQAVVDKVIDGVVVKERAEATRLGTRVTELTTELEAEKKSKGPMVIGTINPVFMADDAGPIDEREAKIEQFERWAARNANGSNLPGSEGYDETKPSYTADQIEQRLAEVLHEKKKILPAARANLQERAKIETALREIYPAIFDPKTPEYAQVEKVLKVLPELKQFADYRLIALKQILGDRALADLLKNRQKKESLPKPAGKAATPPKATPPRAPGGGTSAKGSVLDPKSKQTAAPTAMKKVMSDPHDKTAFRGAVAALTADL